MTLPFSFDKVYEVIQVLTLEIGYLYFTVTSEKNLFAMVTRLRLECMSDTDQVRQRS